MRGSAGIYRDGSTVSGEVLEFALSYLVHVPRYEDPYVEARLCRPPPLLHRFILFFNCVPGPEEPEQAPPSPDYVPGPEHADDEITDPEAVPEEDDVRTLGRSDILSTPANGGYDGGDDEMDMRGG
ncbi:hypothetical protein Tco_1370133 [Tanacetum coccineum]